MPQYEMGLRDYWHILRKRKLVVISCCLAIGALTFLLTQFVFRRPHVFKATLQMSVRVESLPYTPNPLSPMNIAQHAAMAKSRQVLEEVLWAIETVPFLKGDEKAVGEKTFEQYLMKTLDSNGTQLASTRQLAYLFEDASSRDVKRIVQAAAAQTEAKRGKESIEVCRRDRNGFLDTEGTPPDLVKPADRDTEDRILEQFQLRMVNQWDAQAGTFEVSLDTTAAGFTGRDDADAQDAASALAETVAAVYQAHAEWAERSAIVSDIQRLESEIKRLRGEGADLAALQRKAQDELTGVLGNQDFNVACTELLAAEDRLRVLENYGAQLDQYVKGAAAGRKGEQNFVPAPPVTLTDVNITELYAVCRNLQNSRVTNMEYYKPESDKIRGLDLQITQTAEQLGEVVKGSAAAAKGQKDIAEARVTKATPFQKEIVDLGEKIKGNEAQVVRLTESKNKLAPFEESGTKVALMRGAGSVEAVGSAGTATKTIIGLFIGLILGVVAAVLWETFDLTIGTIEEVESYLETRVLGVVPHIDSDKLAAELRQRDPVGEAETPDAELQQRAMLVTLYDPLGIPAESFRHVRTSLDFMRLQRKAEAKVVMVTSATLSEGKTMVAANLAVVMAQNGRRTCLLECDLRRPQMHRMFGIERRPGLHDIFIGKLGWQEARRSLSDLLLGKIGMDTAIGMPGLENLSIITCGAVPPNPVELLDSAEMRRLLAELREVFDVIIVDCPPVLVVADAAVLAPATDGVILVYRAGSAPRTILSRAKTELETVGTALLGVVLNDLRPTTGEITPTYPYKGYPRKAYGQMEGSTGGTPPRMASGEADGEDEVETGAERSENLEDQISRKVELLLSQGKVQEAMEAAHAGMQAAPDSLSVRLELARAFAAAGRANEAQAELIHVLDLDPRNLAALVRLADMATDMGLEREALRWYEEILEFDPQNVKAKQRADEIQGRLGNPESQAV